jgi:hypothetical protein
MFVKGSDGISVAAVLGLRGGVPAGYCWFADKTGMGRSGGARKLLLAFSPGPSVALP